MKNNHPSTLISTGIAAGALTRVPVLVAALALTGSASAQSLLVPHFSQNGGGHVAAFDAVDGSLRSASFIDFAGVQTLSPYQVVRVGADWWVTDASTENAHVWSHFGTVPLGNQLEGSTGDILGAVEAFGATWFCTQGPPFVPGTLIEVRNGVETVHTLTIDAPSGIGVFNGELLVTHGGGAIRVDPNSGAVLGVLFASAGQQGMQQPTVRATTGNLLIARQAAHQDIIEMDASGAIVGEHDVSAVLGIFAPFACLELPTGELLISAENGAYIVDANFTTARQILAGVRSRYITLAPDVTIGTNYCGPGVPNSTGRSARIGATGADLVNEAALRIAAHDLPLHSTVLFVAAPTQGSVAQPGGSLGVLCLGGAIGRYNHQLRNSSTVGFVAAELDTTAVPLPNSFAPIVVGQTWNWQAWYRDTVGGLPVSNFSDAVSIPFS